MAKFKYLSSFDQVTWQVNVNKAWVVRAKIRWPARPSVRAWIELCCKDTVWVWNGTSKPDEGVTNWGSIVCPDEKITYLIFSQPEDAEMFVLKYSGEFSVKYYGLDIIQAWHDSRNR